MEQNTTNQTDSTIWSNTTVQFSKAQVTALSISSDGRKAVIGGKKSLYLIDLEKLNDQPQTLKSQKPPLYDVNQIKWSTRDNVIASTNNQLLNIWDINDERFALQAQLQVHRRPIHDLNWNTFEPNLLTTASLDGYIFLWDTRDLKKPAKMKYFKPGGTCSQVKWNRYRSVILAGSSGGEVRVWDIRTDAPLVNIRAESADIVTLDWSYTDESELLTASHTNNIKFWCIDRPRVPTGTLITPLAVSRAKFSPFGFGIVALSNKNVSSSLDLYSCTSQEAPKGPNNINIIQNYVSGVAPAGNKASITTSPVACLSPDRSSELASFDWRVVETNGYREYQILALSKKDHSLKFIPISAEQQKACGYEPSAACVAKSSNCTNDTKENNTSSAMLSLDQEFSLIKNLKIPNILIEKVSSQTRSLIITAQRGKFLVQVKITFPSLYPIDAPPAFEMLSNISPQSKVKIKEALVGTAQEYVEKNCNCIESCLRKLSILLEQEELSNQTKPAVPTSVSMPTISVAALGGASADPNLPSNMTNYMVKPFDTLASIALTFGMNIAELRQLNKIHHSSQLLPGQNLVVYKKAPTKGKVSPRGDHPEKPTLGVKRAITAVSRGDSRRQLKMSRDDSHISEVKHDPTLWQHAKQKSNIEFKHKFKPSAGSAAVHKAKVKFIDMSNSQQISSITGILTITTTQFIFEPDLDQYAVWERGVLQYTIFNEMTNVISCEVVNSDMFFEDDDADKGTWRFDDEHANALLQVCMDEVQKVTNSKILHFLTPRVKARELSKAIEQWITRTKEKSLMESLNLDSPFRKWTGVNLRRNSAAPSKIMIGKPGRNKENAVNTTQTANATQSSTTSTQPPPKLKEEPRRLSFFEKLTGRRSSKSSQPTQTPVATQPAQKTSIINSFFGEWEEIEAAAEEPSPSAPVAALTSHITKTGSQVASAGVKEVPPAAAEEDDWLPILLDESKLLARDSVKELWDCVPNRYRYDYDLKKLFSTDTNGTSLITFFSRMRNQQPSLIIIRDENQYIFGGFASAPWENNPVFYGTGECFLFTLKPEFNAYKWTTSNNMFMYAQRDGIAMGGGTGGHYGFWIDSEFNCGTSEVSKTFLNRRLSASEEFKCSIVEVWGLVKKK